MEKKSVGAAPAMVPGTMVPGTIWPGTMVPGTMVPGIMVPGYAVPWGGRENGSGLVFLW